MFIDSNKVQCAPFAGGVNVLTPFADIQSLFSLSGGAGMHRAIPHLAAYINHKKSDCDAQPDAPLPVCLLGDDSASQDIRTWQSQVEIGAKITSVSADMNTDSVWTPQQVHTVMGLPAQMLVDWENIETEIQQSHESPSMKAKRVMTFLNEKFAMLPRSEDRDALVRYHIAYRSLSVSQGGHDSLNTTLKTAVSLVFPLHHARTDDQ